MDGRRRKDWFSLYFLPARTSLLFRLGRTDQSKQSKEWISKLAAEKKWCLISLCQKWIGLHLFALRRINKTVHPLCITRPSTRISFRYYARALFLQQQIIWWVNLFSMNMVESRICVGRRLEERRSTQQQPLEILSRSEIHRIFGRSEGVKWQRNKLFLSRCCAIK
jgi:hypothetical protein